jgi:hypothetical protein
MDDTPGADGCITESSLKDEFEVGLGGSSNVDREGMYDDIT